MKRFLIFGLTLLFTIVFAGAALAETGKMDLKVGDSVFACNCGADCPCNTLAKKTGKCVCGTDMVEAKVTKVEAGIAYLQAPGWEKPRPFKTVGLYVCNCEPKCECGTISQKPGKCVCGTEMKKVN
jgi:hypothetical protein